LLPPMLAERMKSQSSPPAGAGQGGGSGSGRRAWAAARRPSL
jgi:hypothetical protein